MATHNQNSKISPDTLRSQHHSWAKGFGKDDNKVYHPYTRIDFKFDTK